MVNGVSDECGDGDDDGEGDGKGLVNGDRE
jgi:hypothetical protein